MERLCCDLRMTSVTFITVILIVFFGSMEIVQQGLKLESFVKVTLSLESFKRRMYSSSMV